jgi:chemotaxis protein histidine kinase CheA
VLYAGLGGPKDKAGARRLYGLAAAQGLAEAQFNLGLMHEDGLGGRKDVLEARRLFGLAAAQGHERALSKAERLANAMAKSLLAEEEAEKGKVSKAKKKKKKSSNQVRLDAKAEAGLAVEAEARKQADAREIEAASALLTAREQEGAEAAQAEAEVKAAQAEMEEQARKQAEQEAQAAEAQAQAAAAAAAAMEKAREPPDHFLCPITQDVMIDPVSAADGHMYERRAIEDWFIGHSTSPMTGAKLEVKMLFPNYAIRGLIRTWQEVQRSVRES